MGCKRKSYELHCKPKPSAWM